MGMVVSIPEMIARAAHGILKAKNREKWPSAFDAKDKNRGVSGTRLEYLTTKKAGFRVATAPSTTKKTRFSDFSRGKTWSILMGPPTLPEPLPRPG